MELISDGLLILAAVTASLYCLVLSRRLRRLSQMDGGLGQMIGQLSAQVDEMQAALGAMKKTTEASAVSLTKQTREADGTLHDMRLMARKTTDAASEAKAQRTLLATVMADCADMIAELASQKNINNFIGPQLPAALPGEPVANIATETAIDLSSAQDRETSPFSTTATEPATSSPPTDRSGDAVTEKAAKPPQIAKRNLEVPEAVGAVLAAGRTEDDEAFARRLIDALAATEPDFGGAPA
ncbi:MAG: hypothetical protein AAF367_15525 [Pseudomonadota bacterium]